MKIKRRDFLKGVAGGAVLAAAAQPVTAEASPKERLASAVGILYDATLCVGCQVCMVACKKANKMPANLDENNLWEAPKELSSTTLNIIKKYDNGPNNSSYVKRQCMHCVDPGCVSVCPVSAMQKDEETGVVTYDAEVCIGCRYCQVGCPYNIPKFEWESAFPKIVKCQLCNHLIQKGEISACCQECPTGASLYGPVDELLQEAQRRLTLTPGAYEEFPVNDIRTGKTATNKVSEYQPHIYGEKEVGGSQVLLLSGVEFNKLGLPDLPDESYTGVAEGIQHTLYKGMILPVAAFAGLAYIIKRNDK